MVHYRSHTLIGTDTARGLMDGRGRCLTDTNKRTDRGLRIIISTAFKFRAIDYFKIPVPWLRIPWQLSLYSCLDGFRPRTYPGQDGTCIAVLGGLERIGQIGVDGICCATHGEEAPRSINPTRSGWEQAYVTITLPVRLTQTAIAGGICTCRSEDRRLDMALCNC